VTAAPLAGLTEPVELMRISPEALVVAGVVTAVLITVSATAGGASVAAMAPRPLVARSKRIDTFPFLPEQPPAPRFVGTHFRVPAQRLLRRVGSVIFHELETAEGRPDLPPGCDALTAVQLKPR